MARKLLTLLGVLFVLGLVGAAVAGLMLVKDRVRVVIQADETAAGPEPLALLRDDVLMLQREIRELRAALPASFDRLGNALEERAEARHADVLGLTESHATTATALRRGLEGLGEQVAAMRRDWAELASEPPATAPQLAAIEPPPEPEPATPPPPRRKSFLSFSVPEAQFRFDEPQDYLLLPELCRVGFDAKSTLHDFTGVTSRVAGRFTADFDDRGGNWSGEVTCEAASLQTGLDGRDTNMREHLGAAEHPQIRFEIERFEPDAIDATKMTAAGTIAGRMTIRGKTQAVRMPITLEVDASKRVVIAGQMPLTMSDYDIRVPSQLGGTITVNDEVSVWIALRARAEARPGK